MSKEKKTGGKGSDANKGWLANFKKKNEEKEVQGEGEEKKKDWWDEQYDDDYVGSWRGQKAKGKAASSFLDDYQSGWWGDDYGRGYSRYSGYSSSSGSDDWERQNDLREISRAVNVPINAELLERNLTVSWAKGGEVNGVEGDNIALPHTVLDEETSLKSQWSKNELKDVLIAQGMAAAKMKLTASGKAEKLIRLAATEAKLLAMQSEKGQTKPLHDLTPEEKKGALAQDLWVDVEDLIAEQTVLKEYPGFSDYFAGYREYYTDPKFEEKIKANATDPKMVAKQGAHTARSALTYELVYPDAPALDLPEDFREAIDAAKVRLSQTGDSMERGDAASEIATDFFRRWPTTETEKDKNQPSAGTPPEADVDKTEQRAKDKDEKSKLKLGAPENIEDENNWHGGTWEAKQPPHSDYPKLKAALSGEIRALKGKLKIRSEEPNLLEHGLRSGQVDEGSLYKLAGHLDDPKVFEQKLLITKPDLAIGLLIDESGSMAQQLEEADPRKPTYRCRSNAARDAAIVIAEALNGLPGVDCCIMGHSSGTHAGHITATCVDKPKKPDEQLLMMHYLTPDNNKGLTSLGYVAPRSNNFDGYAMLHMGKLMLKWYPKHPTRIMFVISDGLPCGGGYGSHNAMKHMLHVCQKLRKYGVETQGIGIDNAYDEEKGNEMYGKGRHVRIAATNIANTLARFITQVVQNSCQMSNA